MYRIRVRARGIATGAELDRVIDPSPPLRSAALWLALPLPLDAGVETTFVRARLLVDDEPQVAVDPEEPLP